MQKHLIKTTEELQKYVRVNISVMRESFLPYEFDAQNKFIIPYTGDQLHQELLTLVNDDAFPAWADTQGKENLLHNILYHTRNALAKLTVYLAAPQMDLHLSEMGFVVTNSANAAPASAARVQKAVDALLTQGHDNLETLLRLLEKNSAAVASYKDSEAFVLENSNIITSASEFDAILPISASRLRFIALRSEMQSIKNFILIPAVGQQMFDQLVEQKQTLSLTSANQKLIDLLKRCLAYKTIGNTISETNVHLHLSPLMGMQSKVQQGKDTNVHLTKDTIENTRQRYFQYAKNYLGMAKSLLKKNAADYPEYKNSPQYDKDVLKSPFENEESGIFVFGSPSNI